MLRRDDQQSGDSSGADDGPAQWRRTGDGRGAARRGVARRRAVSGDGPAVVAGPSRGRRRGTWPGTATRATQTHIQTG